MGPLAGVNVHFSPWFPLQAVNTQSVSFELRTGQTTLYVTGEQDNPRKGSRRSSCGTMQSVQLCVAMTVLMLYNPVTLTHVAFKPLLSCADNGRHLLSILKKKHLTATVGEILRTINNNQRLPLFLSAKNSSVWTWCKFLNLCAVALTTTSQPAYTLRAKFNSTLSTRTESHHHTLNCV